MSFWQTSGKNRLQAKQNQSLRGRARRGRSRVPNSHYQGKYLDPTQSGQGGPIPYVQSEGLNAGCHNPAADPIYRRAICSSMDHNRNAESDPYITRTYSDHNASSGTHSRHPLVRDPAAARRGLIIKRQPQRQEASRDYPRRYDHNAQARWQMQHPENFPYDPIQEPPRFVSPPYGNVDSAPHGRWEEKSTIVDTSIYRENMVNGFSETAMKRTRPIYETEFPFEDVAPQPLLAPRREVRSVLPMIEQYHQHESDFDHQDIRNTFGQGQIEGGLTPMEYFRHSEKRQSTAQGLNYFRQASITHPDATSSFEQTKKAVAKEFLFEEQYTPPTEPVLATPQVLSHLQVATNPKDLLAARAKDNQRFDDFFTCQSEEKYLSIFDSEQSSRPQGLPQFRQSDQIQQDNTLRNDGKITLDVPKEQRHFKLAEPKTDSPKTGMISDTFQRHARTNVAEDRRVADSQRPLADIPKENTTTHKAPMIIRFFNVGQEVDANGRPIPSRSPPCHGENLSNRQVIGSERIANNIRKQATSKSPASDILSDLGLEGATSLWGN